MDPILGFSETFRFFSSFQAQAEYNRKRLHKQGSDDQTHGYHVQGKKKVFHL
jgi:hypothetical protein